MLTYLWKTSVSQRRYSTSVTVCPHFYLHISTLPISQPGVVLSPMGVTLCSPPGLMASSDGLVRAFTASVDVGIKVHGSRYSLR